MKTSGFAAAGLLAGTAWPVRGGGADLAPTPLELDLVVHGRDPLNAEPALETLLQEPLTPLEAFYIRSHAPENPTVDLSSYRLSVTGLVERPLSISLDELLAMDGQQTAVATLTCAGNRRNEHSAIKPVSGVQWQSSAIGNARWTGVRLSALLRRAGLKEGAKHVWFEGLDQIPHGDETITFGGSIPIEKALADTDALPGALVCHAMNGKPLSADHGFPLRTLVPGYIGARSVKWLGKIVVSDRPSDNHYLAGAYKLITEETPEQLDAADPLYEMPLNAAFYIRDTEPRNGRIALAGYALPPGDLSRTIARVELSTDGGKTWSAQARFTTPAQPGVWRLWNARVPARGATQIVARAIDSAGDSMPQEVPWNLKGYMYNAWYRQSLSAN